MESHLSARLQAAYSLFPTCVQGADIGADHGKLSLALLKSGKCQRMLVTDISAKALQRSRACITNAGMQDRAVFCVGDGLEALNAQADAVAICGMGGKAIARILQKGESELHHAALVLSPQTDISLVRRVLCEIGYNITCEVIVRENQRFYILIKAIHGHSFLTEAEISLGPCLMRSLDAPFVREYYTWYAGVLDSHRDRESIQRRTWITALLNGDTVNP